MPEQVEELEYSGTYSDEQPLDQLVQIALADGQFILNFFSSANGWYNWVDLSWRLYVYKICPTTLFCSMHFLYTMTVIYNATNISSKTTCFYQIPVILQYIFSYCFISLSSYISLCLPPGLIFRFFHYDSIYQHERGGYGTFNPAVSILCQWAWENIIPIQPSLMLTLWTVSTNSATPYEALVAHGIHVRVTNICVQYGKAYIYWHMPEFLWKSCTFCALMWSHLYNGYKYSI